MDSIKATTGPNMRIKFYHITRECNIVADILVKHGLFLEKSLMSFLKIPNFLVFAIQADSIGLR